MKTEFEHTENEALNKTDVIASAELKAKELLHKFHPLTKSTYKMALEIYGDSVCCLIILVDEMIAELKELPKIPYNERRLDFWKNVKFEIGKL